MFGLEKRGQDECLKRAAVGGLIGRKRNRFYSVVFRVLLVLTNGQPGKSQMSSVLDGYRIRRYQCKLQGGQLPPNTKEEIYGSIIK